MNHEPDGERRLLAHLRARYGIDAVAATRLSVHKLLRLPRRTEGRRAVGRPKRFHRPCPKAGVEGDAAILRFLEREDYPAERLAVDDAGSGCHGSAVLVTRLIRGRSALRRAGEVRDDGEATRPAARAVTRRFRQPRGRSERRQAPSREGAPRQDLLAALAFLDAVDTKVAAVERERFERLRNKVRSADDCDGLPEGLLHGNLLHAPDHAVLTQQGPIAINWKASGNADCAWPTSLIRSGARSGAIHVAPTRSASMPPSTPTAEPSSRRMTNSSGSRRSCTSGRSTSSASAIDAPSPTA